MLLLILYVSSYTLLSLVVVGIVVADEPVEADDWLQLFVLACFWPILLLALLFSFLVQSNSVARLVNNITEPILNVFLFPFKLGRMIGIKAKTDMGLYKNKR